MYAEIKKRCDVGRVLKFLSHLRDWRRHFLGQRELSRVGEAQGGRIAAEMLQKEIYLLKLPAIRHGRHHLCQLFLLALQHPVNMLHRNLGGSENMSRIQGRHLAAFLRAEWQRNTCRHHVPVMFYSRVPWSCPWWALLMMWCCRIPLPPALLQQPTINQRL